MKFGPVPLADAEGAILAHSIRWDGGALKKGRVLSAGDVDSLRAGGFETVTVARPEAGDVLEDEAAARIAARVVPDPQTVHISLAAPFTGRANLYAEEAGVLRVDTAKVHALNGIDEGLTLATLADHALVSARQMVGTVKIIPYGVPGHAVAEAESLLTEGLMSVHPVTVRSASVVLTRTPGMADKVVAKGGQAVRARLAKLGIAEVSEQVVAHETAALANALSVAKGDLILILTGSATSDREDVGPAAVRRAGGEVHRFGMPVDPGNLLFLGALVGRPVIGLPGCARSPKLNGADWVLERLACGLEVSAQDIAAMGVGGLLKEIPSRPEPRGGGAEAPRRPHVTALLLAAGGSTRMEGRDKLLEEIDGVPLIRRSAEVLLGGPVDEVVCVLRPEDEARRAALSGLNLTLVENPRAAEGMGTSISAGVSALGVHTDALLVALGDMPEVTSADVARLIAGFDPGEGRAIVRAVAQDGTPGNPVLIGRRFFEALAALDGDRGAKVVLAENSEFVVDVPLEGRRALTDLDTPEDWARWRAT